MDDEAYRYSSRCFDCRQRLAYRRAERFVHAAVQPPKHEDHEGGTQSLLFFFGPSRVFHDDRRSEHQYWIFALCCSHDHDDDDDDAIPSNRRSSGVEEHCGNDRGKGDYRLCNREREW